MQAALEGAEQIGFTILSLTVSLIAVLIPAVYGRNCRKAVPRIHGNAGCSVHPFCGGVADTNLHHGRPHPAAREFAAVALSGLRTGL